MRSELPASIIEHSRSCVDGINIAFYGTMNRRRVLKIVLILAGTLILTQCRPPTAVTAAVGFAPGMGTDADRLVIKELEGGGDGYKFLSGPDPATLRSSSTRKKSDAELLRTIHDGKPNMPPWNIRFSKKESEDVLSYVRSLAK